MNDIARALGVTKGTVSKALSGAEDVSESMRKAVLEKAVELGYSRIVRSGEKKKLCILVFHMAYQKVDDFGYDIVTGFRKMAEPAGYAVDIVHLDAPTVFASTYDEFMMRNNYLGALVLGMTYIDRWMEDMKTCRTPAILYDNRVSENPMTTRVGVDNDEGMHLAVSHLKRLGHQKIGYLSSELKSLVYQERYQAFFSALKENGLDCDMSLGASEYYTSDCIKIHLPRLIEAGCTAIVCSHDLLAHGAMIHCAELGVRIPGDLSIVGFDDIPLCRFTSPPLTTIRQNRTELGKSAFYALQSQLSDIPISTLQLHAELIERASTAEVRQ